MCSKGFQIYIEATHFRFSVFFWNLFIRSFQLHSFQLENRDHDIYSLCKSNFSTFYSVFAAMKLRRTQCLRTKTTNSYALRSSFFADSFLLKPSSLWSGVHIIDRVINLLIRTKIIQTHRAKKTDHIIGWISCNRKVWFSRLENEIISSPNH